MSNTWAYDPEVARGNPGNLMASNPALPGGAQQCRCPAVAGPPIKLLQVSEMRGNRRRPLRRRCRLLATRRRHDAAAEQRRVNGDGRGMGRRAE